MASDRFIEVTAPDGNAVWVAVDEIAAIVELGAVRLTEVTLRSGVALRLQTNHKTIMKRILGE